MIISVAVIRQTEEGEARLLRQDRYGGGRHWGASCRYQRGEQNQNY